MLLPAVVFLSLFVIFAIIALVVRGPEIAGGGVVISMVGGFIGLIISDSIDRGPLVTETYTVQEWATTDLRYNEDMVQVFEGDEDKVVVGRRLASDSPWSTYAGQVYSVTYFLEDVS